MFGASTKPVAKVEEKKSSSKPLLSGTKYKGKITVKPDGAATLASTLSSKLRKSGTAFVDFSGGDLSNAKLGINDLQVLDDLVGSVEWTSSKKAGKLKLVSSHVKDVTITATPTLPLPADLTKVDVKVEAKKKLDFADAKVTVMPLAKQGTLELIKKLDSKLCKQAKLVLDSSKQNGTLTLNTPTKRQFDLDHSLELKVVATKEGVGTAECLYTAGVTKDLSAKLLLNKEKKGKLSAEYKISSDLKAIAECPITALNAQGLGKPTFTIETTYQF